MCATSSGELDGNVSSHVIVSWFAAMLLSKNSPTASLPRTPVPSGLVTDLPIGSSMTTSSAISASQPARSWAWTHRHDDCDAASAGEAFDSSVRVMIGLPVGVGEADDAANVLAVQHVLVAVVDLLQLVLAGDHVVQVQLAGLVHREQLRDVVLRVAATEDGALQVLLHQGQHRQVEVHVGVQQAADGGEHAGATLLGDVQIVVDVGAV